MSKYDPLRFALERERADEKQMTFKDVERLLGFGLPDSARRYQPWWANTGGSHVHAQAWLKAGWKTSRVDIAGERLVFVRETSPSTIKPARSPEPARSLVIQRDALSGIVLRMIQHYAREAGEDEAAAVVRILREAAIERRRKILAWFRGKSTYDGVSSVDLIREDRDAR